MAFGYPYNICFTKYPWAYFPTLTIITLHSLVRLLMIFFLGASSTTRSRCYEGGFQNFISLSARIMTSVITYCHQILIVKQKVTTYTYHISQLNHLWAYTQSTLFPTTDLRFIDLCSEFVINSDLLKQPSCSFADNWIMKMCYLHVIKLYSAARNIKL